MYPCIDRISVFLRGVAPERPCIMVMITNIIINIIIIISSIIIISCQKHVCVLPAVVVPDAHLLGHLGASDALDLEGILRIHVTGRN